MPGADGGDPAAVAAAVAAAEARRRLARAPPASPLAAITAGLLMGRGWFFCDAFAICLGFFLSLLPTWVPDEELVPHAMAQA